MSFLDDSDGDLPGFGRPRAGDAASPTAVQYSRKIGVHRCVYVERVATIANWLWCPW